jgi:AcrR family transcriptional regulator
MDDVNGDELTRQLIDEGARLLAEQGPAGLSLRKLAAAVGTSTMTVYTRFGGKEGLLAAMYREGFGALASECALLPRHRLTPSRWAAPTGSLPWKAGICTG